MRRWLSLLVTLPFALVVILFAVANLQPVTVSVFPLPFTITLPLAVLVLGTMTLSFLMGSLLTWFFGTRGRWAARRDAKRAAKLEKELAELRTTTLRMSDAAPASGVSSVRVGSETMLRISS